MKSPIRLIISYVQPVNLLLAGLSYMLGLSIVRYLGITIKGTEAFLGGCVVILILSSSNLFNTYFASGFGGAPLVETPQQREILRRLILYVGEALLVISGGIVFILLLTDGLSLLALVFLALDLIIALSIAVPPIRLAARGYGELASAILLSGTPVLIAFLIQVNTLHRLVTYLSFPLVILALAYYLVLDFPTYSTDQSIGHQSMLVRLTWQRAIPLHNLLIVVSYLFYASGPLFGIPTALVWPPLLTVPLAIYEIIMLRNISAGLKPNWSILTINSTALMGLTVYLLMLTFWLR